MGHQCIYTFLVLLAVFSGVNNAVSNISCGLVPSSPLMGSNVCQPVNTSGLMDKEIYKNSSKANRTEKSGGNHMAVYTAYGVE